MVWIENIHKDVDRDIYRDMDRDIYIDMDRDIYIDIIQRCRYVIEMLIEIKYINIEIDKRYR